MNYSSIKKKRVVAERDPGPSNLQEEEVCWLWKNNGMEIGACVYEERGASPQMFPRNICPVENNSIDRGWNGGTEQSGLNMSVVPNIPFSSWKILHLSGHWITMKTHIPTISAQDYRNIKSSGDSFLFEMETFFLTNSYGRSRR